MRIHFCGVENTEIDYWQKNLSDHQVTFGSSVAETLQDPANNDIQILSVFVNDPIDDVVFRTLPNLKFIAARSTGINQIDTLSALDNSVLVSNVPEYGSNTVAEFTIALLMSVSRKVYQSSLLFKTDQIIDVVKSEGFDLFGKTIAIIGTGRIGSNVARMARAFGMKIVAFDKYPNQSLAVEIGFEYLELESALHNADIVSLHAPLNNETYHLLDANRLAMLKPTACIINTARGGLIDTQAMARMLENNQIAGAALDVIEDEEFIFNNNFDTQIAPNSSYNPDIIESLLAMDNVIITPHIAYNTIEAKQEIMNITLDNIRSYINGNPINIVK